MPVAFYGKWSLVIVSKDADFQERVRIVGSSGSDGVINGVAGQGVASIDGASWQAFMEWSSDGGTNWFPSRMRRTPSVTAADGLIVTLGADDNTQELGDGDFNDLVAQFVYLNREINPVGPGPSSYSFTAPATSFWPARPGGKPVCSCQCVCTCQKAKPRKGRCKR